MRLDMASRFCADCGLEGPTETSNKESRILAGVPRAQVRMPLVRCSTNGYALLGSGRAGRLPWPHDA